MDETGIRAVFAESLIRERTARGLTRGVLARKAGISPATLSLAERQLCGVGLETAAVLAEALGVPLAVMVSGEQGAGT